MDPHHPKEPMTRRRWLGLTTSLTASSLAAASIGAARQLALKAGPPALLQGALTHGLAGALAPIGDAHAQTGAFPSRPIKLIVVYPTGGVSDSAARLVAEQLSSSLGQPVVVENRAGAAGSIGMEAMLKAEPDGHTIAFAALSPLTINPHVMRVPYEPLKDIAPLASMMYSPVYLIATPAFTGNSFADLLTQARSPSGALNMATSGIATVGHLMLEQLNRSAGTRINHVPYKGGGQVITDAVGGQFELLTSNPSPALNGFIAQGKLRVLAVTGPARLPSFPQVPTVTELGFPAVNMTSTFGFFGSARMSPEIVRRLNQAINTALGRPELIERLLKDDNIVRTATPEQFAQTIQSQHREIGALVRAAGIKAE